MALFTSTQNPLPPQWRHYSSLPPHIGVTLPALSPTMTHGSIVAWAKKVGDRLEEGDVLAQIETDKATMDMETPDEGWLAKILVEVGTLVPIGQLVCIIVSDAASIAAFANFTAPPPPGATAAAPAPAAAAPAPAAAAAPAAQPPSSPAPHYHHNLPPHYRVTLPALSPTMTTGKVAKWEKAPGDELREGDVLAQIETDKATMDMETPEEGWLAKTVAKEGESMPIGRLLCIIAKAKEDLPAFENFVDGLTDDAAVAAPPAAVAPAAPAPSAPSPAAKPSAQAPAASSTGTRVYASPMARRLAEVANTRLDGKGSGMYGSITSKDLGNLKPSGPSATADKAPPATGRPAGRKPDAPSATTASTYTDVPVSSIRAVIGKRLLESKITIPHFYVSIECNMNKINEMRTVLNAELADQKVRLTVNDFVLKACAIALLRVPEVNSTWMETVIRRYDGADISVAVSSDKGLITPIVWQADGKSLVTINADVKRLAQRARDGKLQPAEFQGGSFTISNLGMFGVSAFSAIVNPPQTCILAVGGSIQRFVVPAAATATAARKRGRSRDIAAMTTVTLSCDHRAVDGAEAAEWLKQFQKIVEEPYNLLI